MNDSERSLDRFEWATTNRAISHTRTRLTHSPHALNTDHTRFLATFLCRVTSNSNIFFERKAHCFHQRTTATLRLSSLSHIILARHITLRSLSSSSSRVPGMPTSSGQEPSYLDATRCSLSPEGDMAGVGGVGGFWRLLRLVASEAAPLGGPCWGDARAAGEEQSTPMGDSLASGDGDFSADRSEAFLEFPASEHGETLLLAGTRERSCVCVRVITGEGLCLEPPSIMRSRDIRMSSSTYSSSTRPALPRMTGSSPAQKNSISSYGVGLDTFPHPPMGARACNGGVPASDTARIEGVRTPPPADSGVAVTDLEGGGESSSLSAREIMGDKGGLRIGLGVLACDWRTFLAAREMLDHSRMAICCLFLTCRARSLTATAQRALLSCVQENQALNDLSRTMLFARNPHP